ncbi:MAG: DUF418 domain-containing protein [Gammaproteobacteria bacterium]|nr:DUF418 domain-containing protein [Gammaproteobacteria bacterium]
MSETLTDEPRRLQPVAATDRIETLDVLRGFALFGILLVNIHAFYKPLVAAFDINAADLNSIEYAIEWMIGFFAQGKFYPLFSFLFGLGFAVQLTRAEARGAPFLRVYIRRLLALLAIGVAHGTLVWAGDILTMYAILGFVMLLLYLLKRGLERPFRRADGTPRRIPFWAVLLVAVIFTLPSLAMIPWMGQLEQAQELQAAGQELTPQQQGMLEQMSAQMAFTGESAIREAAHAYGEGSWMDATEQRVRDFQFMLNSIPFWGWLVLAMFLIGAVFGRLNLIGRATEFGGLFRSLVILGLAVGVPMSAVFATQNLHVNIMEPSLAASKAMAINQYGGLLMALMYVAGITLLMRTGVSRYLGVLAPVGRMALSNYLLQSIVSTTIFYGYGFGLFGDIGSVAALAYVLVFFALQVPLSHWWLKRFRFGPAEWLWRSLTYGRFQPLRL